MADNKEPQSKAESEYRQLRQRVIDLSRSPDLTKRATELPKLMRDKADAFAVVRNEQRAAARGLKRSLQEEYVRNAPEEVREEVDERINHPTRHAERKAAERKRK